MEKIKPTISSKEFYEQAKKYLVGGVASAIHKGPGEDYPIYIESGKGSRLYDVDGNEYIDYLGAYGPMILGYSPPELNKSVIEQIEKGSQFAAPFKNLNLLSEKLVQAIPCANLVSYQSTGTEANMLAFRLARAYSGKEKIVKFEGHYHGWSDEQLISSSSASPNEMGPRNKPWKLLGSAGQRMAAVDDIIVLPWNDPEIIQKTIKRHAHQIAAIITEPVMCNCEPIAPLPDYLQSLREISQENEIVLIFDEVITGFRLALGGAQEYYGVIPDLCTFGKAVAGGYPLAGVAGKREIMTSSVHPVGTFNANPIVAAAGVATLTQLEGRDIYEHMARITRRLTEGITNIGMEHGVRLYCAAVGSIWQLQFGIDQPMVDYRDTFNVDKETYQRFRRLCQDCGIRFHPTRGRFYVSAAHNDNDVDRTLEVSAEAISMIARS